MLFTPSGAAGFTAAYLAALTFLPSVAAKPTGMTPGLAPRAGLAASFIVQKDGATSGFGPKYGLMWEDINNSGLVPWSTNIRSTA